MGNIGFKNTYGEAGAKWGHPTITTTDEITVAPYVNMSVNAGNLALVDNAGTITITSTASNWDKVPSVGDKVFLSGFTSYSGVYTLTGVTDNTITFTATSAGNETITSDDGLVRLIYTPVKNYQDVAFTSGIPNTTTVSAGASGTLEALAGVYSYLSASNGTDVAIRIGVAGGYLTVPAGSSIGHEVRPFTTDVTCDATGASLGTVILNIS